MPDIHRIPIVVAADAIDAVGHVNNTAYVRWMQDVAVAHSSAQGWPMDRYLELGAAWFVRSHFVEYLLPAFVGDDLQLATWVADMRASRSTRRYLFWRDRDRRVVARAETLWVFVDLDAGRPRPIPPELRADFELVDADEAGVLRRLGLRGEDLPAGRR